MKENPGWHQFSTLLTKAEDIEGKGCWGASIINDQLLDPVITMQST
jgi:hypothetical protein